MVETDVTLVSIFCIYLYIWLECWDCQLLKYLAPELWKKTNTSRDHPNLIWSLRPL